VNFVSVLARHYFTSCRVMPAHGLHRQPKHGRVGRFHVGLAQNSSALHAYLGGTKPAAVIGSRLPRNSRLGHRRSSGPGNSRSREGGKAAQHQLGGGSPHGIDWPQPADPRGEEVGEGTGGLLNTGRGGAELHWAKDLSAEGKGKRRRASRAAMPGWQWHSVNAVCGLRVREIERGATEGWSEGQHWGFLAEDVGLQSR
jgi:hypothetical protein